MNYTLLSLQLIPWVSQAKGTSGETWAYSNRKPAKSVDFFGDTSSTFTVSRLTKGEKPSASTASDELVTVWLNGVSAEEVELYRAEYGDEVYIDENDKLLTVDQYNELGSQDVDTSEQPFA